MSRNWPEHLIDEIIERVNIVDVISDYVVLAKKGKNYLGLCPFHHEKTPSFTVTPDKQMFYCFGCQTGGNAITFLSKRENLSFAETVKLLADRVGISLPEAEVPPEEKAKNQLKELIAQVNKAAKDFYHDILLKSPQAQNARDYLAKRGIDYQTIDMFQLGFAPEGWSHLLDFLKGRGYSIEDMLAAGVITPKDVGGGYDRFRNRIMYPIVNIRGQVIGFGGRVLDDSLPKYLNTSETAFFNKGHNLYGIDLAHKSIREKGQALVVEGYMDVIAAHQSGFTHAVASLGTALTKDQGRLILRFAHEVLLAYDSDSAGITAALRGAETLRDLGCRVKVLTVPSGKDPDEFLRSHSPEEFDSLAAKAPGFIQYKLARLVGEKNTSLEAKVEIVNNLAGDIQKTESLVEREGYIRLIANTLGITEEVVNAEIRRISSKTRKIGSFSDKTAVNSHTNIGNYGSEYATSGSTGNNSFAGPNEGNLSKLYRAENLLLRLMLEEPKVISVVEEQLGWEAFSDPVHIKVMTLIKQAWSKGTWNPANSATLTEDEFLSSYLARMLMQDPGISSPLKAASDCIRVVKEQEITRKIKYLQEQATLMQNSGDMESALRLLQDINRLVKQPDSHKR